MASPWDLRGPHYYSNLSPESRSAYWATSNSNPASSSADHRPRNLAVPAGSPPDDASPRRRKATSLRSLIRRRPSDSHDSSHSTTSGRSQSLSPQSQAQPVQPVLPVTPYDPPHQRSISQPPGLARSVSAHLPDTSSYPSPPASNRYPSSQQPLSWDPFLGPRPAQTYPRSSWDARSSQLRTYSYYEPDESAGGVGQPSAAPVAQYSNYYPQPRPPVVTERSRSSVSEGFENPADFRLFVEATSGLPDSSASFTLTSPQSPPSTRPNFSIARRPPPPQLQTNFQSHPSQPRLQPPVQIHPAAPRTPNQMLADSIQSISGDEDDSPPPPPDCELPDYAQSQAEESARRRREATIRAAELERRWAEARRSNR